jgi:hypothetical protein
MIYRHTSDCEIYRGEAHVTTIVYKGYEIDAVPYHLADGTWDTKVRIAFVNGSQHNKREFTSEERFKTEQEAVENCFHFGKRIVDGWV